MNSIDDKSTLVQVMACCHQATNLIQANVDHDLYGVYMVSLGHSELTFYMLNCAEEHR